MAAKQVQRPVLKDCIKGLGRVIKHASDTEGMFAARQEEGYYGVRGL